MKLSICVVNYHSCDQIAQLLSSLCAYRPTCLYEVVIVNNSPQEKLKVLVDDYGDFVRIIEARENLGFGKAQNIAVQHAKGDYVLFCNPDIEVQDGGLRKLLAFADSKKRFGVAGPRLEYAEGGVQSSARTFPGLLDLLVSRLQLTKSKRYQRYLMTKRRFLHPTEVDWMVGAVLLVQRERFLKLGGFDERFFLFFEDTDLCRRFHEAGYGVWYVPDSIFFHSRDRLSERGFWVFKKVFWIHLSSALKYFWKWRACRRQDGPSGK